MTDETGAAPAAAKKRAKRPKRGRARELEPIDLGAGVILWARPPRDAFAQAEILAAVEADMDAMIAAEPQPTSRDWDFGDDRVEALRASEHLRLLVKSWMRSVVQAEHTVERVEGIEEEDGAECAPSFDLFAALFERETLEMRFRARMLALTRAWDDEGNASGRARNGLSQEGSSTAPAAGVTTPRAPEDSVSPPSTESASAALSTSMPQDQPPAPPPGELPPSSASGATQALAAG